MQKIKAFAKSVIQNKQLFCLDFPVDIKPRACNPHVLSIIDKGYDTYNNWLNVCLKYQDDIVEIGHSQSTTAPHWNNGFLPGLDIITLYSIISELKPRKYLEVGSGNSTKVAHKAKLSHSPNTEIISIDPAPRAEIDHLADRVIRSAFEGVDLKILDELKEGDILFIDNSHRLLPNSDATVFFMEALPRLGKGVLIQVHDIYLPYDYPQNMCERWYNENYALGIYLMAGQEHIEVIMPNYYISTVEDSASILNPIWKHPNLQGVEKHGGSFWFRKV